MQKNNFKVFMFELLSLIIMFDILGFLLWVTSGQIPDTNLYIGVITKSIINIII